MGKEPQPLHGDGGEWEFPPGKELGALLKAKREEMGLTYHQISDQIRVKAGYLEALENEEWDHLPSPPFIKGFIRSYARAIGLSEEGLIALYQEIAPPPQPMPRPLQATPKKNRVPLYLIAVFAVLAGGVAVYYWVAHSNFWGKPAEEVTALSADERSDDTAEGRDHRLEKEEAPPSEGQQMSGPIETGRELPRENPATAPGPEEAGSIDQPAEAHSQADEQVSPSETGKRTRAETPIPDTAQASESDSPPLVLKATVRERTWVRVTIDDQKPKEYIFDPKSSPEWRAHKGFELLIGNARGIDLEFNGRKMEDLGKQGQVIKLRLPAGTERSVSTD